MTKTEHYQLNQWDPEDPVRRTDFNEDNARLDAAMNDLEKRKAAFVKLKEWSPTTQMTSFELDVTGIDWSAWHFVFIDVDLRGSGTVGLFPNQENSIMCPYITLTEREAMRVALYVFCMPGRRVTSASYASGTCYGSSGTTFNELKYIRVVTSGSNPYISPGGKVTVWGLA